MKKFFVGLLSVFLLFGASILSACGANNYTLLLSKENVEIQIFAEEEESYEIVIAEVKGIGDASISATAKSGYENIVKVSTSKISATKVSIKIEGLTEGEAEISVKSGDQTKYIHAVVYSEVSSMTQKVEDSEKKNNYLVCGQDNILNDSSLIEFYPSEKSRRQITWSLENVYSGVTLNENILSIDSHFSGDNISLLATTEKGIETIITLPVLEKIDVVPLMGFSYSKVSSFEHISEGNRSFKIVPNVPTDEKYIGYIMIVYVGDLEITGYALDEAGNKTDDIIVNRDGFVDNCPVFAIYANKDQTDINGNYTIGFRIGYKDYNYAYDTMSEFPIEIVAREMINGIIVSTNGAGNAENTTQTLYTSYGDSQYSTVNGQEFNVMMIPSTVINASNKYSITLTREEAGGAIAEGCPIEIWYRDMINGGIWTMIPLVETAGGAYQTRVDNLPTTTTIYIKASETLKEQAVEGLKLTFTSKDNPNVSTSFKVKLVRSVSAIDFVFPDGGFKIDSSVQNLTLKKQFTLTGQTSIEGLYIVNNSNAVVFDEIHYISNDEESVTFEVAVTLQKASYGITTLDSYHIAHKNGLLSEALEIDIFLPLKEASMYVDNANNKTNSVVDTDFNKYTYNIDGELISSNVESLSAVMLKNNSTTPIIYSYNEINNISAVAKINVEYYDFNAEGDTLSRFLALIDSEEGRTEILNNAHGVSTSAIAYFTTDFSSIITKGVGHTYAVVSFVGKGTENVDADGNVTFVRIFRIESLVTPEGMNVTPESDKTVELYSIESLATSDESLTRKNISIKFNKTNITYQNIININFVSRNELMGKMSISADGNTVSWDKGRYTITNIKLTNEEITFTISALHTYGEYLFADTLDVHYVIYNNNEEKVYDISSSIKININNAQRIESLVWDNYDKDGLYFEIGDNTPQYMLFKTSPTNAKNTSIAYVLTDKEGVTGQTFVTVSSDAVSNDILAINLAEGLTEGMIGYIYILPADAIYNNQIKYYYLDNGVEKSAYISPSALGSVIDNEGTTNYEYLINNAFFKSSVSANQTNNVSFKEILLKVQVTVADGKSFEHSYRIYDEEGFVNINPERYYTVMTSLDIDSSRNSIYEFKGGLQGYNKDVTVKLNGANFAFTIEKDAEIRNIKFNGLVNFEAVGFIANINKGRITNVTVDVDGIMASNLISSHHDIAAGGIVGLNYGIIDGAKVLGLNITTNNSAAVGGIAAINFGEIKNSAVEFYNLCAGEDGEDNPIYESNKFTGNTIGAIVGVAQNGSSISNTYAYDYTLANGSESVFVAVGANSKTGAFVGKSSLAAGETSTINYAFSVVGQIAPYNGYITDDKGIILTNYYCGYYSAGSYSVNYVLNYESNPNFVQPADQGFDSEVNGGFAYLKKLQQSKRVTDVAYDVQTVEDNGYYKSVQVDSDNGILFYYALKESFVELNTAEKNDLNALNTITLAELVGDENVSENIIITSSNLSIIKVVGSSLIIRRTGDIEITLSSKQNVQLNKKISVKVVNPLSQFEISWVDLAENVNYVEENSQLSIQKTRSRDFSISLKRSQVYLGALATSYNIVENDYNLKITTDIVEFAVENQVVSNKEFKLISHDDSLLTTFMIAPQIFEDENYQLAIENEFTRTFKILPTEGLIAFAISDDTITISPSINASIKAEIKTTALGDTVYPVLIYNGNKLSINHVAGSNKYSFTILGDVAPIIEAVVSSQATPVEVDGVITYVFDVNFAVCEEYKSNIAEEYEFDAILMSESGNSSEEWGGKFKIHISEQKFTNIDVSNRKITSSNYRNNGEGKYIEVHTASSTTSVLAPGNSSILEVNVNPTYAYYDYAEISYSGAKVSNAVNIVVVEPLEGSNNEFTKKEIKNNNIETINSKLIYRPSSIEKKTIYYKLWVNTTVNRDTTLCFTVTFYRQNGEILDYVNYYLTISYLTEATITVDGSNTTYLARGSSAEIKIDVLPDQKVDNLLVEGEGLTGVSVSQLSQPTIDNVKGIKTYTAQVYANVFAECDDHNTFYLKARVSRELNGTLEIKDAIATVVIVDFKLDTNSILISNSNDGNLSIWQGVSKPFTIEYKILPNSYPYPSNEAMKTAIQYLSDSRELFEKYDAYPVVTDGSGKILNTIDNTIDLVFTKDGKTHEYNDSSYYINYIYDNKTGVFNKQSIYDRLFVVVNNEYYPLSDDSVEKPFDVIYDKELNTISFKGTKVSGSVQMVLMTYITSNYVTKTIETPFTLKIETYSDPDLPIKISNAADFKTLNPNTLAAETTKVTNDYILENDIILENYSSFDTTLISSLDGNGHTIFIKSFNLEEDSSTLNLALFKQVKEFTTLKNIRVNLYNGGQLTININKFKEINIAGLAIENEGVITNCEVVSFYTESRAMGEVLAESACNLHSNAQGLNIKYVAGNGTDEIYLPDNASWSSQVAGFVLNNAGSITNSRVGGDEIIIVGAEKLVNEESTGYTYASTIQLNTFNIVGQGNIAGFVLANSGYITSSYVRNIDVQNNSNSITFYTSGFVGVNNSSIITSYIEGTPSVKENMPAGEYSQYAFEGTSIRSRLGYVVGFVYNNQGSIKDSYSNILIANASDETRVYYASGFVYMNEGSVENCYSASQISNSKYSQMNFSGVNESGELLKNGEYINCYFFNKYYEDSEDNEDYTTESQYGTGALLITKPAETSGFYGFAIADGENDGIWRADEERGITLIEANKTTISNRYTYYVDDESFEGVTAEDSLGRKYILPYSILTFVDTSREINTTLGTDYNPILIYDAQDFIDVTGTSTSTYIKQYFNNKVIWGSYRLVNNINLLDSASGEETVVLPSSTKAFAGRLYGNGFSISGISISSDSQNTSFGLFKSIETRLSSTPIVTNLDLIISQVVAGDVVMVGGLAGYIKDAKIINIDIQFKEESMITGLDFVGGLAGLASGNNIIKNINITNPVVKAERMVEANDSGYYFKTSNEIQSLRTKIQNNLNYNTNIQSSLITEMFKYAFAGSVIGYVDNFAVDNYVFDINQAENYSINNVRVGGSVNVQGQIVGGVFGFTGYQTNVRDIGLTIDTTVAPSKILSTKLFAGGVIGQSFGAVSRTFAVYDEETQNIIEDNISNFYQGDTKAERGQLDIFSSGDTNYEQQFIGGLIGYAGSGILEISYSKLNVVSNSALYAGGVIGCVEATYALTYKVDPEKSATETYTKYLLKEVYATGDVRADADKEGYAGGIIGVIKGKNRVALLAVNALNYFTSYNYENETYRDFDNSSILNMSTTIRANAFVGHFIDITHKDGNVIETLESVDILNYGAYVNLVKAGENSSSSVAITKRAVPSIGYYEGYYENTDGRLITVNILGSIDGRIDSNNILYTSSTVFAVAKPLNYENSSVGHTYTQAGFLNSGAWSGENWVHNSADLFPEIRYKRNYEILFLDQYNIKEVFTAMQGNDFKVIVRGRISAESETCGDIDLTKLYYDVYGSDAKNIESYSGVIQGGGGQTLDEGALTKRDVKIITDRTFIESTGPGFSVMNLTIDFLASGTDDSGNDIIEIENGLLTNSAVTEAAFSDLILNIKAPVVADLSDSTTYDVGLIAPSITSTLISGLKINATKQDTYLLKVTEKKETGDTLNVGLIAGTAIQKSTIATMFIEDVTFSMGDAITLANNSVENVYVGSYFGQVQKEIDKQPFIITLGSIKNENVSGAVREKRSNITLSSGTYTNAYLGGFVGASYGINTYNFYSEENQNVNVDFNTLYISSLENLYVGGLIGIVDGATINGADSSAGAEIQSALLINEINNLYAGGIIATNTPSAGPINISNFPFINFEILNNNDSNLVQENYPSKDSLAGNYDAVGKYTTILSEAKVGAVAGKLDSQFTFNATNSSTHINSKGYAFRLSGDNISAGSLVGEVSSSITIKGSIVSDAEFMINSTGNNVKVGGMIGSSLIGDVNINAETGIIVYNGAVYSNTKEITFGGILGYYSENHETDDSLEIKNTAFGGALKIYGANSHNSVIIVGGTVGHIHESNASVIIQNNYNYGDVFVEYGSVSSFTQVATYNFGGILGLVESSVSSGSSISDNYSLVTSHNARYYTYDTSTANALFASSPVNGLGSNYYNHAVCLITDDLGVDRGYSSQYDDSLGYYGYSNYSESSALAGLIHGKVSALVQITNGHKLSPDSLDNISTTEYIKDSEWDNASGSPVFNGMIYFNYSIVSEQLKMKNDSTALNNVAIIGNGFVSNIDFTLSTPLVNELTGYSYIAGIHQNLKIKAEESTNGQIFAPFVGTMKQNSIVYAINVAGTIDVGGVNKANVSAIVGKLQAGKIFDCSSDVDITYRAGAEGGAYALTNAINNAASGEMNYKAIENCYTAGSISTMIKADVYAFANSTSSTNIKNGYTYTKLMPNDYVNATPIYGTIGTFGEGSLTNCYYDIDGLGYYQDSWEGTQSTRSSIISTLNSGKWTSSIDFNSGYPTLNYLYMKTSSYVKFDGEPTKQGDSGYDQYVLTYNYTKYLNGSIPTAEDLYYYYYIPNGAVLFSDTVKTDMEDSTSAVTGVVLRYDINLSSSLYGISGYSRANSDCFASEVQKSFGTFVKVFEGNEKTIKGITQTLFGCIAGAKVRNLRLTDVSLTEMPALAEEINGGSLISNMTFSGSVNYTTVTDNETGFGAIARRFNGGAEINTSTNMIELIADLTGTVDEANSKTGNRIGGFFGIANDSTIKYCGNYGPVRMTETNPGWDDNVGGLVGLMTAGTIEYSYNAAAVLGNYSKTDALSTTTGVFFTGGLVGYLNGNGEIKNSYNSGMIKSGNKSNGIDNTQHAYAGGIVGKAEAGSKLSTCYNEGTVEALGVNPSWKIDKQGWNNVYSFDLVVYGTRNVHAYGIGYLEGEADNYSDLTTKIISNTDYNESVKNNGYAFNNEEVILKSWELNDVYSSLKSSDYSGSWKGIIKLFTFPHNYSDRLDHSLEISTTTNLGYCYDEENEYYDFNVEGHEEYDVKVTAVNDYGIPTRIIVPVTKTLTLKNIRTDYANFLGLIGVWDYTETITKKSFTEFGVADYDINLDNLKDKLGTFYSYMNAGFENQASNISSYASTVSVVNSNIKKETRSQEEDLGNLDNNSTSIGGVTYYVADSNNFNTVFEAGINSVLLTDLDFDVPYNSNLSKYQLTTNKPGISAKITRLEKISDKKVQIDAKLFSSNEISNESLALTLKINHQESFSFSLRDMDYYVNDDYSFAIDVKDVNGDSIIPTPIENYSIGYNHDGDSMVYNSVVKFSTVQYSDANLEPIDDTNSTFIYLAKEETGKFIYIPNATLDNGLSSFTVNQTSYISEGDKLTAENTKDLIDNLFKNKTLYYRVQNEEIRYLNISDYVTNRYSGSLEFTAGEESNADSIEFSYGTTIENTTDDFDVALQTIEVEKEVPPVNEGDDPTYEYEYHQYYTLALSNDLLGKDMIALDVSTPFLSYNKNTNQFALKPGSETFEINGTTYNNAVKFTNNGVNYLLALNASNSFIIKPESVVNESVDIQNIQNYFASLTYIANTIRTPVTITDKFNSVIHEGTEQLIIYASDGTELAIAEKQTIKYWYHDANLLTDGANDKGDYTITKSGFDLSITLNEDSLTYYELGGIKIYYNDTAITVSGLTEKYTSKLLGFSLKAPADANKNGLKSYYMLALEGISTYDDLIDISASGSSHGVGAVLGDDELTGNQTLSYIIYNTYKEKTLTKEENNYYKLALEDDEGNQYYIEVDFSGENCSYPTKIIQSFTNYALYMNYSELIDESSGDTFDIYSFSINGGYTNFNIEGKEINSIAIKINQSNNEIKFCYNVYTYDVGSGEVQSTDTYELDAMPNITCDINGVDVDSLILRLFNNRNDFSEVLSREEIESVNYIYSKNFKILNSLTWWDKTEEVNEGEVNILDIQITRFTQVGSKIYDWFDAQFSDYSQLSATAEMSNATATMINGSRYEIDGKNITVYLKNADRDSLNLEINKEDDYLLNGLTSTATNEPHSIILKDDISLNENLDTNANINIFGNNYYISYYDSSLYSTLNANGSLFRDILFLGETYDSKFLNDGFSVGTALTFENIAFYGAVNNLQTDTENEYTAVVLDVESNINNSSSFISVNGRNSSIVTSDDDIKDLSLFGTSALENVENHGVIIAADGVHGVNGDNGVSASDGKAGIKGQSIIATNNPSENELTDFGVVKAGTAGNGGAGGSNKNEASTTQDSGVAGKNGGIAGIKGEVSGFKDSVGADIDAKNSDAYAGVKGADSRSAFLSKEIGIETVMTARGDDWKYVYAAIGFETTFYEVDIFTLHVGDNLTSTDDEDWIFKGSAQEFGGYAKLICELTENGRKKIINAFTCALESVTVPTVLPDNVTGITVEVV